MLSDNEVIVAAAGGGKTTRIVDRVLACPAERVAVLTFTQVNTEEVRRRFYAKHGTIPPHVEVWSWLSFLLNEMARPYQSFLYPQRIDGIAWSDGRSAQYVPKHKTRQFYFADGRLVYTDKIAQFVVECNTASNGAVIDRVEQRFRRIYIDEIQDMAGYDLDVIELLMKSSVKVVMVGDHRQATYATNNGAKNSKFRGVDIIKKFEQWRDKKLVSLSFESDTYRSNQCIADFADALFPTCSSTRSNNNTCTGHDGVFVIRSRDVNGYISCFSPQVLRYDRRTKCGSMDDFARNFGECKGLTFERVLIFPNGPATKWLTTGESSHISDSVSKMYVGITRARYSVTFVLDKEVLVPGIMRYFSS